MNLSTSARGKAGIAKNRTVIALAILVLLVVGAYGVLDINSPTHSQSGHTALLSTQASSSTTPTGGSQAPSGLLDLFGNFSKMSASDIVSTMEVGPAVQNVTYTVLGHTLANSTEYYRVEFTLAPQNVTTILWFDQHGNVTISEVMGDRNYTGAFALLHSGFITSLLSLSLVDRNASQLLGFQKTGADAQQSIGGTQMTVSTFDLIPSKTSTIANETIMVATLPGTNFRLIVYIEQTPVDPEGSSLLFKVNSLSK